MNDDNLQQCARQCGERAWRLACALMRNAHDAEDVVQEAFVVAARRRDRIPSDDPWPWFATAVSNVARNARRTRSKHMHDEPAEVAAPAAKPDLSVLVAEALAQLPEPERDAIACTHLSGLTQAEAAAALDVPVGTVATRVRAGLAKLRAKLGKSDKEVALGIGVMFVPQPQGGIEAATQRWLEGAETRAGEALTETGVNMTRSILIAGAALVAIALIVWFGMGGSGAGAVQPDGNDAEQVAAADNTASDAGPEKTGGMPDEASNTYTESHTDTGETTGPATKDPQPAIELKLADELVYAEARWPTTLDPHNSRDAVNTKQLQMVYEGLLESDPFVPSTLRPCIAAGLPKWDAATRTYAFTLHDDVRFHDDPCFVDADNLSGAGREVTAVDVLWSIKRMSLGDNYWLIAGRIEGLDDFRAGGKELAGDERLEYLEHDVAGLQAPDDHTVRIKLTGDPGTFLFALASVATSVLPREALRSYGDDLAFHPVGTGPYVISEFVLNRKIVYDANPGYREVRLSNVPAGSPFASLEGMRLPLTRRVVFEFGGNAETITAQVREGRAMEARIGFDELAAMLPEGETLDPGVHDLAPGQPENVVVRIAIEPTLQYWRFNMNDEVIGKGDKARAMRQALSLGFDRAAYIRDVLAGRAVRANGLLPQGGIEADCALGSQEFDAPAARKALADAGFELNGDGDKWIAIDPETGRQPELCLVTRSLNFKEEVNAFVGRVSGLTGIAIRIEYATFPEYLKRMTEADGQIFDAGWVMDYPAPEDMYGLWYDANDTLAAADAEYAQALHGLENLRSPDPEQKQEGLRALQTLNRVLDRDVPFVAIAFNVSVRLCREGYLQPEAPLSLSIPLKYCAVTK